MTKKRKWISGFLAALIAGAAIWFFGHEVGRHIDEIKAANLAFHLAPMLLGFLLSLAAYLVVTQGWRDALNEISAPMAISFKDSVPAVNIPSLTKYVPGKVWSYAIQMLWLKKRGFAPAAVLYTNLLFVASSLLVSAWLGSLLLLGLPADLLPKALSPMVLRIISVASVFGTLAFILLNKPVMQLTVILIKRVLQRDISLIGTSARLLFKLQAYHVVVFLLFGLASFFLAAGIGLPTDLSDLPRIIAAVAIADAIGFLVLLVPGGLGVRESVMYVLLGGMNSKTLALLLPIVSRLTVMLVEVLLGGVGLFIVKMRQSSPENEA